MTRHYLNMTATCPADGRPDYYELVVESKGTIMVEKILVESLKFQGKAMYQEEITKALANKLKAKVTTVGMHSGVKTVCEA